MVYTSADGVVDAWYAGFEDDGGWRLNQVKGVARDAVLTLMAAEP
jgi:hypothetical protein